MFDIQSVVSFIQSVVYVFDQLSLIFDQLYVSVNQFYFTSSISVFDISSVIRSGIQSVVHVTFSISRV